MNAEKMLHRLVISACATAVSSTAIRLREYTEAAWSDLSGAVIPVRTGNNTSVWFALSDSDYASFIWNETDCPPLVPHCVPFDDTDVDAGTISLQLPGFPAAEKVTMQVASGRVKVDRTRTDVVGVISQQDMPRAVVRQSQSGPFGIAFSSSDDIFTAEGASAEAILVDDTSLVHFPIVRQSLQRRETVLGYSVASKLATALKNGEQPTEINVVGDRVHIPCETVVNGKLPFSLSLGTERGLIEIPIEASLGDGLSCPTSLLVGWILSDIELGTDFLKNVDGVELGGNQPLLILPKGSLLEPSIALREPFTQFPRFVISPPFATADSYRCVLDPADATRAAFTYTHGPTLLPENGQVILGMVSDDDKKGHSEIPASGFVFPDRVDAPTISMAANGSLVIESKRNPEGLYGMASWTKLSWLDEAVLRWIPVSPTAGI